MPNIDIRLVKGLKDKQFQHTIRRPHNIILAVDIKQQKAKMPKTPRSGLQLRREIICCDNLKAHNVIQYG
jgi:hypothetical protein